MRFPSCRFGWPAALPTEPIYHITGIFYVGAGVTFDGDNRRTNSKTAFFANRCSDMRRGALYLNGMARSAISEEMPFLFSPKIWYYIIMFECEESAYKHWITRPQIDYVITHPVKILEVESKRKDDRVMAFLGYVDEFREKKIEVLVSQRSRKAFHAMECRTEWLRYFDE